MLSSVSAKKYINAFVASAAFILVILLGEFIIDAQKRESRLLQLSETTANASALRALIERELNAMLYLNSGLTSYLIVRHDNLQEREVENILSVLHRSSRYVRNFGIAVGYRLTYVYPRAGNESAIGMDYRSVPKQWPIIKAISESGLSALDGPIDLVQGGTGLIYRVPLFIDNQYWGLLSTVIDFDALTEAIFSRHIGRNYQVAVLSRPLHSEAILPVLGDQSIFSHSDSVIQHIDVPGGAWMVAVLPSEKPVLFDFGGLLRLANLLLGMLVAWLIYAVVKNKAQLAELAMFDSLTGLPNRRMLEERHRQLLARMQRHPELSSALLFLDLDRFKIINDRYSHKAGDTVLKEIAKRLRRLIRVNDVVARWGGVMSSSSCLRESWRRKFPP